ASEVCGGRWNGPGSRPAPAGACPTRSWPAPSSWPSTPAPSCASPPTRGLHPPLITPSTPDQRRTSPVRPSRLLAIVAVLALVLGACADDDSDPEAESVTLT